MLGLEPGLGVGSGSVGLGSGSGDGSTGVGDGVGWAPDLAGNRNPLGSSLPSISPGSGNSLTGTSFKTTFMNAAHIFAGIDPPVTFLTPCTRLIGVLRLL